MGRRPPKSKRIHPKNSSKIKSKKLRLVQKKQSLPQWIKDVTSGVSKQVLDKTAHIVYLVRIYVAYLDDYYFKIGISDCGLENHINGLNSRYNSHEQIVLISAFVDTKNRLTKDALRDMFKYNNIQYDQEVKIRSTRPTVFYNRDQYIMDQFVTEALDASYYYVDNHFTISNDNKIIAKAKKTISNDADLIDSESEGEKDNSCNDEDYEYEDDEYDEEEYVPKDETESEESDVEISDELVYE